MERSDMSKKPEEKPGIDPSRKLDDPARILPVPDKEDYDLPRKEREKKDHDR